MTSIRIGNELDYGTTANLLLFIKWKAQQKLLKHRNISKYYIVATILRIISCISYGNVTSSYFETTDHALESSCEVELNDYLDPVYRPA